MEAVAGRSWEWLRTGDEMFPAMLSAIQSAQRSVRFESYIFAVGEPGVSVREALTQAAARGVKVKVLMDGLGAYELPADFWSPLREAGGEARTFNPFALRRLGIRDHRKLLVCDERVAFVGGFNIAPDYLGDGVTRGWCDLGLRLADGMADELAASFDEMFARADFQHKAFPRLRRTESKRTVAQAEAQLLLSGPGRGPNPIQRALLRDMRRAYNVRIVVPYFLPSRKFRRAISRAARRGGEVQLILPAKSDVALSQLAGRSFYGRLLRAGVEIFEYEPQVLHAKLFLVDGAVYVGSSNLDVRSLRLNYELMVRCTNSEMAEEAEEIFRGIQSHCRPVRFEEWRASQTFWTWLRQRWAHFVLTRVDPYIARRQWRALPD